MTERVSVTREQAVEVFAAGFRAVIEMANPEENFDAYEAAFREAFEIVMGEFKARRPDRL